MGVFLAPRFTPNRLAALEDGRGFTRGLGIITRDDPETGRVTLLTPLPSLEGVTGLRLGDIAVWPGTWRDEPA